MPYIDNETDASIAKAWDSLPVQLQQTIIAAGYREEIQRLTKELGLHIDQAGALEEEVMMVLLGMTDSNEFTQALTSELGFSQEQATKISSTISEKVFAPVAKHLKDALLAQTTATTSDEGAAATPNKAIQQTDTPGAAPVATPMPIDPYREPID